jgi:hypothetical protein
MAWHLPPDGPDGSRFSWHHSDLFEVGTCRCDGNRLTGSSGFPSQSHTGEYHEAQQRIVWDDIEYAVASP